MTCSVCIFGNIFFGLSSDENGNQLTFIHKVQLCNLPCLPYYLLMFLGKYILCTERFFTSLKTNWLTVVDFTLLFIPHVLILRYSLGKQSIQHLTEWISVMGQCWLPTVCYNLQLTLVLILSALIGSLQRST